MVGTGQVVAAAAVVRGNVEADRQDEKEAEKRERRRCEPWKIEAGSES